MEIVDQEYYEYSLSKYLWNTLCGSDTLVK